MADNKQTQRNSVREQKKAIKLNNVFRDTLNNISYSIFKTDTKNTRDIDAINTEIEEIITKELTNTKSITSDDMSTFMVKLFNDEQNSINGGSNLGIKNLDDIFTNDSAGLFQFFQERYRNKNLLFEDLNMITAQLFELDEAVNTTRDAIITADDITQTISRKMNFINMDDRDKVPTYIAAIEKLERELKLPTKLKNLVIPYTLTYGQYYVYVCPYAKLFEQQYKHKISDTRYMGTTVSESIDESFVKSLKEGLVGPKISSTDKDILKTAKDYTNNIEVYNNEFSIPLIEGTDMTELLSDDNFKKMSNAAVKKSMKSQKSFDGVVDTSKVDGMFDNQSGCYIKFIEPKKIIPVKILDTVIGYYYIHDVDFEVNKAPFSTTIKVTNNAQNYSNNDLDTMFISRIADNIVKSFDKKFLETNEKFKDMILNALIYNDMYKKQIKFQFIPKDYIVEFKVNEDEDGNGRSILTKSLFYAKLYMALLVFKMITIITKSNDTRVYYVKNSGMEQNVTNKIQEVARSVKGRQINFMDLLNYNSIISKIGANKEIFMPVGRTGDRGIEFDILAGQDVQLNTDLMDMLRTNMINGTGVPSVIMNYVNEADYAKTLVMANSKFVGRVVSYQIDLNPSITDLYKLIIKFSNISIPEEEVEDFIYTLNSPKTLNTVNMTDMMNAADMVVMNTIKAATGESAEQNNDSNQIKDIMYNKLIRDYLPSINWGIVDDYLKEARIELEKRKQDNPPADDNNQM